DITERKEFEKKINDLARFPSENPNPVLRLNKEEVIYANKTSQILFEIGEGDKVPILLKDMVIQAMDANITKTAEIELDNQIYSLVITPIKEANHVNVYGRNITVRKIAEQAIQKRNKEISMLLDAARAVLQYSDFKVVAELIFESCINLIGADAGYIALLTPDKKQNKVIFLDSGKLQCEVDPDLIMPIRGMRANVIKSKKTLYYNDFSDTDWINLLPKGHIPLKNILFAPLIINDGVKGLMGLANREGGFTEEEARLATTFAELASISLLNSQTLEALEKSEHKYKRLSNILEQKVEERTIELKESEEKIQNMITNISEVLLEAEPSGILTYISPQINNLIGYQSEQLIGLNFMDFVHLEDTNLFKKMADKALETKKAVSIECRLKHKKGYFVPISARWSMVEINNEFKVFGLVSDNTERKKIDEMIKREIKQLKELDQIRNDLIRRISHELNTPLISILNGSQFLLDSYNDQMSDEAADIVDIVHQGGYRLKEIVDNLITVYELETEQLIINIKRVNLIPIIKECVDNIIFQADKRKIIINIELLSEIFVDVDRRMIKKVILNLLSNAVKNTLPNGNIFIKSIEHHKFIEIVIRDTGVGLTKKEKLLIFKKFGKIERFGKGMDVDIEGPGLGLYISKEITKLHKGELLIKSKGRNKGSTFILRLFLN
ncbi:MAG TPA: PAS domain S-box protein, partial [bacterium]|nr:PAS domain S-box protein [bacterium]